jgi:epoxyqueuosine reductase
MASRIDNVQLVTLAHDIKRWGSELGFQQVGISNTELSTAEGHLQEWLTAGHHGEMEYMASHGKKRSRPEMLLPGTTSVISVSLNNRQPSDQSEAVLARDDLGFVSRYALGRDYHKLLRSRLQKLARQIEQATGPFGYRVFTDSAPVMEKPLAQQAGLGWIGKHSTLVSRNGGSWFFLGEIYTDLPLPIDHPSANHCGSCTACIDICPTQAIVAPYVLDARRCIAYLTIELHGSIPLELRPLIGNRIYGCDDCLLTCPWNRFATPGTEQDFLPRNGMDAPLLIELFAWSEDEFKKRLEGSAIRRIGHERWLRNIAVAMGNATPTEQITTALKSRRDHPSEMVREHVEWAIAKQRG